MSHIAEFVGDMPFAGGLLPEAPAAEAASPTGPLYNFSGPMAEVSSIDDLQARARVNALDFWYSDFKALKNITLPIVDRRITALIGASGSGKSTLLRCFNRLHDLYPGNRYQGEIRLFPEDVNIIDQSVDPLLVRLRVGMVFQKPNPFPKTVFDNVASGLWVRGIRHRGVVAERVESALMQAALWDEVKDRLDRPAYDLSGGQQQRLCIARALAPEPELLLLDEPTSSLDPIATGKIEELMAQLGSGITLLIVTHDIQQAARISDFTAYMHCGELVEYGDTNSVFMMPKAERTRAYLTGRLV